MRFDFEEMKKAWEKPFRGDHVKVARRNLVDGITKAHDYHTKMVRNGMDAMNKMHDWWIQSVEWYIDSNKKMTDFFTERLNVTETTEETEDN